MATKPHKPTHNYPGEFEQMLLLAILQLGNDAYAIAIRALLEKDAHRSVSRGALYRTLDRMHEKGYVSWTSEDPTADRGGHSRRLFAVTELGLESLRASRSTLLNLWTGLEPILEKTNS